MNKAAIIAGLLAASSTANGEKLTLRKLSSENRWSNYKSSFAKIYVRDSFDYFFSKQFTKYTIKNTGYR